MTSIHCSPGQRADIAACLDNLKASVLAAVDRGDPVTFHQNNTLKPLYTGDGAYAVPLDMELTGWTFAVSIGSYPHTAPGKVFVHFPEREPVDVTDPATNAKVALPATTGPQTDAEIAEYRRWMDEQRATVIKSLGLPANVFRGEEPVPDVPLEVTARPAAG